MKTTALMFLLTALIMAGATTPTPECNCSQSSPAELAECIQNCG